VDEGLPKKEPLRRLATVERLVDRLDPGISSPTNIPDHIGGLAQVLGQWRTKACNGPKSTHSEVKRF